ncbi:MAG: 50S ribosomal protein L11 methyltransferase [Verrucomicrobia bacterium]|nr:50S ribosomal protein L11 methyltransferase [Verrucomicrobiota bacterium]
MENSADNVWFVLTLEVRPDAATSVGDLLRALSGSEPVAIERPESEICWIEGYFHSEVEAELAKTAILFVTAVNAVAIRRSDPHDWSRFWQHHFHGRKVSRSFFVCPEWEQADRQENRHIIVLNPGLSFGTGDHFTTRFCLESLDDLDASGITGSLLDVGTGSGILAIAGSLLGLSPVLAVDHDSVCIEQAKKNAALNNATELIEWDVCDISQGWERQKFDVVCANLYGGLLFDLADTLARIASQYLVLSGIREPELDGIAERYVATGIREKVRDSDGEWAGLVFEMPRE